MQRRGISVYGSIRVDAARLFQPRDCVLNTGLKKMRLPDPEIAKCDRRITWAESDCLLLCYDAPLRTSR